MKKILLLIAVVFSLHFAAFAQTTETKPAASTADTETKKRPPIFRAN